MAPTSLKSQHFPGIMFEMTFSGFWRGTRGLFKTYDDDHFLPPKRHEKFAPQPQPPSASASRASA